MSRAVLLAICAIAIIAPIQGDCVSPVIAATEQHGARLSGQFLMRNYVLINT
jgi:hypothetical protein